MSGFRLPGLLRYFPHTHSKPSPAPHLVIPLDPARPMGTRAEPAPATVPVAEMESCNMGLKTFLSDVCKDAKKVFSFLVSKQGQKDIAGVEMAAETVTTAIDPAAGAVLTGAIDIANNGLSEIIRVESLAAAAGAQSGTGAEKSAAVISAITPSVLSYAEKNGLAAPTGTQIQDMVDGLVKFLNSLPPAK